MTIEQLKDFYDNLRGLFYYDSQTKIYSMALNEVSGRYFSAVAKLKRYLVQKYYTYGVTDVTADQMFDEIEARFEGLSEYSFISTSRDSTLAALDDEAHKLGKAYANIKYDYYDLFPNMYSYICLAFSALNKNGYALTDGQRAVLRAVNTTKSNAETLKGMPLYLRPKDERMAEELEAGRRSFVDFIRMYIDFLYKHLVSNGHSQDFCPLVETAYVDALNDGRFSVTEILKGLGNYNVPKRNTTFIRFKYAD